MISDEDSKASTAHKLEGGKKLKKKRKLRATLYLLMALGILHVIIGVLAFGILEPMVTALIFGPVVLLFSLILLKKSDERSLLESQIITSSNTIAFLNIISYILLIVFGAAQDRFYINILMGVAIVMDAVIFSVFFFEKIKFEDMNSLKIIDYLSIIIIKGIGTGLLFYMLAWTGKLRESPNFIMITYHVVFGTAIMILGEKLYRDTVTTRFQATSIGVLLIAMLIGIFLFFVYPDPRCIVNTVLFVIVITTRAYFLFK
ncbi:MAG: hypothetical protein GF383_00360 [Candidatus Lokiarchaeota archaeon]|nr:hypothetical protein [Candidatus Lokiarchaeota archaeon]MBD3337595.1 hypothetical protein [Candidatus Lokiarchaeota archaeon]